MAMTADGKIATANRAIRSFGSRHDQEHLLELRATADAVLCGASTAAEDGITLGPGSPRFRRERLRRGLAEYNLRIIASGSGRLSPRSTVFRHAFSPVIVLSTTSAPRTRLNRLRAVADEVALFGKAELDLPGALRWLHKRWRVRRLVCEGGGELNDAMFREGLVDELHLTICPKLFGGRNAPTLAEGAGFKQLADAVRLRLRFCRRAGDELYLVYEVVGRVASRGCDSTQRAMSQSRSDRRLK
ncbi:MAG: dihydrofolate reductase family protein [Verrucomicrobia bacterium]|jgi:riboflavin-specific deaminase-like protein|nr:dihydrofolate reductase family protein [Verrucomicrobiota bacterium]